jgi:murein DD-endopeptidase MepM/ murein hydrolase activator NlpD
MLIRLLNGYPITSGFGDIDNIHKIPHKGIDIQMPEGTPLHSVADGIISRINDEGIKSFGKSVRIKFSDGSEVIYGHLSKISVRTNDHVHAGDIVGFSGNTGNSPTGSHLHLQLITSNGKIIDPTFLTHDSWWRAILHGHMPNTWKGALYPLVDGDTHTTLSNSIGDAFVRWITYRAQLLIELLNANAAEITTLGIVICAGGLMIAPITGGNSSKWFGKMFIVFFVGAIWQVFIP